MHSSDATQSAKGPFRVIELSLLASAFQDVHSVATRVLGMEQIAFGTRVLVKQANDIKSGSLTIPKIQVLIECVTPTREAAKALVRAIGRIPSLDRDENEQLMRAIG
jgi:hypothetical protein